MKVNIPISVTFFIVILFFTTTGFAQRDWTSRKKQDGIEVFVKSQENAVLKTYRAVASTTASIDDCVNFLLDLENHVNWSYTVEEASIIPSKTDDVLCYMLMDAPWPVLDRDIIIKASKNKHSANKAEVSLVAIEGVKKEVEDVVRITESTTKWKFTRKEGVTHIVYEGVTDPGGKVPDWVINAGLVDGPFETIKNFIHEVEN
ncbi:START domain-containing protein [Parvicella tangerina]|uniref:START domain-containing protein n=1 Tax=Parvicella tangerina TaxID=2829795 RepID=A0A916JN80_9FLAO|nr:START domain-containing protein [Parvicella tangerina]CAG5082888.1 hypothetical protein CRYO30217_02035 [Parvicella tangerina]